MFYLYAISDNPEQPLPDTNGHENVPIAQICYRGLAAIISPALATSLPATRQHVWQHEAVIEALMASRTALPARFGTLLPGEAAVYTTLAEQASSYWRDLERVRGAVELGVRVLWQGVPSPVEVHAQPPVPEATEAPTPGRRYMLARLAHERTLQARRAQAVALAHQLHGPLAALARASHERTLLTEQLPLTGAYLVDTMRVAAFRQAVEQLRAAHPQLRILCTGPWPAYSFVGGQ